MSALLVVCLCAEWCDTCREYRPAFERLREEFPMHRFIWVDIEEQHDLLHDIEVENFPTLLVTDQTHVLFAGTILPQIGRLRRLLKTLGNEAKPQIDNLSATERTAYRTLATQLKNHPA